MTCDGTTERRIEVSESPVVFRAPQYVLYHEDRVHISDNYSHALIIIDLEGHAIFAFKSPEFENPAGMTVDHQGNLYVCGKTSHNVLQISRDGEVREILAQDECSFRPCSVSFMSDGCGVLVASADSNILQTFQFE
jgi:sugar lactone lactonase YvrE